MVAMTDEDRPHIERRDMKAYGKSVQDLVLHIVNDCGIPYRNQDGGHMLLFPPDGGRPFKIASARPAKTQARYLEKFIRDHGLSSIDSRAEEQHDEAEVFRKAQEEAEQRRAQMRMPTLSEGAVEWRIVPPTRGGEPNFETNGKKWRCLRCKDKGDEWITDNPKSMGGHIRGEHREGPMWTPEQIAKRSETVRRKHAERRRREAEERGEVVEPVTETVEPEVTPTVTLQGALEMLANAAGLTVGNPDRVVELEREVETLTKRIETLRSDLERETKRADEAEARVALMKEVLGS